MSGVLLDVNVLLALNWQHHPHHTAAIGWFDRLKTAWATCPFTECGFIRLSSNPKIVPGAHLPEEAAELIRDMRAQRSGLFWADDVQPSTDPVIAALKGHQQVTDAYLLALARRHKGQVATFDNGLVQLARGLALDKHVVALAI